MTPPTFSGTPPAGGETGTMSRPPNMGGGMSDELLAKVAGILGIETQTLKDAFTSSMPSSMPSPTAAQSQ